MIITMPLKLAKRMDLLKTSEIREILKITQRREVISFAGGLPAPELFPVKELGEITNKILEKSGDMALQYSTTEGYAPLRENIAKRMNRLFSTSAAMEDILITNGSQQAIDFAGRLFLDDGDIILCESPTYLAALSAFKSYMPRIISVPTDDDGMIMEELEKTLQAHDKIKLIYVIPDFQNPTGRTWNLERRRQLVLLAHKYNVAILEDNPYGELRFEGEILPAIKSFDAYGIVTYISTFSKTFCPGMRIGWLAAAPSLYNEYVKIKQGADLHTSTISQMAISQFIDDYPFDDHVKDIIALYKERRDFMIKLMEEKFPAAVTFTRPQGGLFIWVELPKHVNTTELLYKCLENNVAFVPGASFFPDKKVEYTLRMSFSNMSKDRIKEGIERMAAIMNVYIV